MLFVYKIHLNHQIVDIRLSDVPEKFLVTSKVVNMAPCSDRTKGRKEVMINEGRKKGRDRNRKIDKRSTVRGQHEGHHF